MKTKINFLLRSGLSKNTLVKLNESKINLLYEKFKKKEKEETKEQVTPIPPDPNRTAYRIVGTGELPPNPSGKGYEMKKEPDGTIKATPMETEMSEGDTESMMKYDVGLDPDQDIPTEGFLREKFESKAQQGLFWARCNKCSSKNCKWCKMAKEFSDSTSKKQYKNMPEKKHPEKTVKYKKKKTNESLQKFIENTIIELLESKVDAKMTKKDLINSIKNSKKKTDELYILDKPKKMDMFSDEAPMELPIGRMFSIGKRK